MYPQLLQIGLTGYIAVAGWFYFLQYQKHSREQAVREANLQKLSGEAELKALKTLINPHFLFNTLNSLNALVIKDPKKTRMEEKLQFYVNVNKNLVEVRVPPIILQPLKVKK
jgi:LytS/YehU family sensor histidine kinase